MSSTRRGQEFCLHFPHFSLVIVPPSTPPPLSLLSWWWSCSFVDRDIREDFGWMLILKFLSSAPRPSSAGVTTGWQLDDDVGGRGGARRGKAGCRLLATGLKRELKQGVRKGSEYGVQLALGFIIYRPVEFKMRCVQGTPTFCCEIRAFVQTWKILWWPAIEIVVHTWYIT